MHPLHRLISKLFRFPFPLFQVGRNIKYFLFSDDQNRPEFLSLSCPLLPYLKGKWKWCPTVLFPVSHFSCVRTQDPQAKEMKNEDLGMRTEFWRKIHTMLTILPLLLPITEAMRTPNVSTFTCNCICLQMSCKTNKLDQGDSTVSALHPTIDELGLGSWVFDICTSSFIEKEIGLWALICRSYNAISISPLKRREREY